MTAFYNIGSLVLGLAAWIFALLAIKNRQNKPAHFLSVGSFSACALSLLFQIFEVGNRVSKGDLSAVMDTIRAVMIAAALLVLVTVILNLYALTKAKSKE